MLHRKRDIWRKKKDQKKKLLNVVFRATPDQKKIENGIIMMFSFYTNFKFSNICFAIIINNNTTIYTNLGFCMLLIQILTKLYT